MTRRLGKGRWPSGSSSLPSVSTCFAEKMALATGAGAGTLEAEADSGADIGRGLGRGVTTAASRACGDSPSSISSSELRGRGKARFSDAKPEYSQSARFCRMGGRHRVSSTTNPSTNTHRSAARVSTLFHPLSIEDSSSLMIAKKVVDIALMSSGKATVNASSVSRRQQRNQGGAIAPGLDKQIQAWDIYAVPFAVDITGILSTQCL